MPFLLVGGGLALLGLWIASQSGGAVVRRSPPPPVPGTRPGQSGTSPRRPDIQPIHRPEIQPVRPAAPGVAPSMTQAIDTAQSVHDTRPAPTDDGNGETIHWPSTGPHDASSVVSPPGPQRPPPPSGGAARIPTAAETSRAISASHDSALVVRAAHHVIDAIRGRESDSDIAASVTNFQNAYGQGLAADGAYGRQTRHAMSLVLGMSESALPALRHA